MTQSIKSLENTLSVAWNDYNERIESLARGAQIKYIIPWLDKHNYYMLVGNGAWAIFDKNRDLVERIPQSILNILSLEVEGFTANDLGSLMPSYDPNRLDHQKIKLNW